MGEVPIPLLVQSFLQPWAVVCPIGNLGRGCVVGEALDRPLEDVQADQSRKGSP
jgi:hypothetical protein